MFLQNKHDVSRLPGIDQIPIISNIRESNYSVLSKLDRMKTVRKLLNRSTKNTKTNSRPHTNCMFMDAGCTI